MILGDVRPVALPLETRQAFIDACRPNPLAGQPVRLIAPHEDTKRLRLRLGKWLLPCPCCGELMVTLDGLPGFFPAWSLETYEEVKDDAD